MSIEKITKIATKIVLTGGIASGKTYVSDFLQKTGIPVIDLDIISKEITTQNIDGIIAIFGEKITTNSRLDKEKLKTLVFNNSLAMKQLEEFLHPKILTNMQKHIKHFETLGKEKIIIVVPLLIEKNLYHYFDKAIMVTANTKVQQQRMISRDNIGEKLAKKILNAQATNAQRRDIVKYLPTEFITNNSTILELETQIKNLHL